MHVAVKRGTSLTSQIPARFIAGRRFSARSSRCLHSSTPARLSLFPPWGSDNIDEDGKSPTPAQNQPIDIQKTGSESQEAKTATDGAPSNGQSHKDRSSNHGSAARRWMRNRRPKDIPPIAIPTWFLERNVKLREDEEPFTEGTLQIVGNQSWITDSDAGTTNAHDGDPSVASAIEDERTTERLLAEQPKSGEKDPQLEPRTYRLNQALMGEVIASISAGLSFSQAESVDTFLSGKSHLRLHCPLDGGTYFLERIVEQAAAHLQADVIRLDAQDLAEIAGSYIKEGPDAASNSLWSLGYDAQQIFPNQPGETQEGEEEGSEGELQEDLDGFGESRQPRMPRQPQWTMTAVPLGDFNIGNPGAFMKKITEQFEGRNPRGTRSPSGGNLPAGMMSFGQPPNPTQQRNDFKLGALLEVLVEANQIKRVDPVIRGNLETTSNGSEPEPREPVNTEAAIESQPQLNTLELVASENLQETARSQPPWPLPKTILQVRGYKELSITHQGRLILEKLQHIVQKKRKEGQQIILVGTTASAELTPEVSRAAFETLQSDGQDTPFRTMVVTPDEAGPAGGLYYRDTSRRIREINVRHLHDMIKRLSMSSARSIPQDLHEFASELDFGPEHAELSGMLEEQVFAFDEVHRIALTALGTLAATEGETGPKQPLRPSHIVAAMHLLDESDGVKTEWAKTEQQLQQTPEETARDTKTSASDRRLKKIRKTCNSHEKSLLRGVVNPDSIRTTFKDVHAPPETIESLKNLTTLSLTRPEAFKYGVLATDKITGLLLYGPPGTGKTLLAKAVAKESGATVLEVSGSDVYDMYVGESEKNVRAIFTLARKLSPCVVFVDEADAIFASRGSGTNRNSHKELINQFLREWDGMTDTNAFIMVATNRPFDLDDAALRRLPRRLLVDLPVEKDREAILAIHLREEALDPAASLPHLAANTPLYSGSDLKNLAVAAALTAVREENDAAAAHAETGSSEPFVFPERRTLTPKHFEKAMEEITASVSDDMSSLGAIRKFDEQYGDRRGRRKGKKGYGFAGGEGVREDAVKVRS